MEGPCLGLDGCVLVMDLEAGLVHRQLESLSCQAGVVLSIVGAAGAYSQRDMVTVTL